MNLIWDSRNADCKLQTMLRTLAEEYPLQEGSENVNLFFEKSAAPDELKVSIDSKGTVITYGRDDLAARGVAYAMAGQEADEKVPFSTHGILFDCTRGNIITVDYFKHWLRRLALLGYNMAMIYVKDAYQLPGEPYFGYMRGAYSLEEMREVDAYAKKLNIEMIASIQALGHLEPIMRWPAYEKISDTSSAILVDEPASYELLEKILKFWSDAFDSRRIHLGMDETHDLGRGRFMDMNGYENPFNIYNRHLGRVCAMCEKLKLEPIIWADMYFRYANKEQFYYDTTSVIPEEVKKAIPRMVQLSYWDYYHRESDTYEKMLKRTSDLNGCVPMMAAGVHTWARFWTDYEQTMNTIRPCVTACKKLNIKDIVYTMWGDDGGYCDFDSAFAGLAWASDYAFNPQENEERISKLYAAVCGTSYKVQLAAGELCFNFTNKDGAVTKVPAPPMLWDDPLMGITWHELPAYGADMAERILANYEKVMAALEPHRGDCAAGRPDYPWRMANLLAKKVRFRQKLEKSYRQRDMAALAALTEKDIPEIIADIDGFLAAFRSQWLRSFKPYGMEQVQIRLGGLKERYMELANTLRDLIDGKIEFIPVLDDVLDQPGGYIPRTYLRTATGSFFI